MPKLNIYILLIAPTIGFIIGYFAMQNFNKSGSSIIQKTAQDENILSTELETTPSSTRPSPTSSPTPESTMVTASTPYPTAIPTPKPTKVIIAPADLEPLFEEFSKTYKVDEYKLKKIADCESHFNRGVWSDPYAGMYQFKDSTWTKYRNMMGKDPNIDLRFGARESIETAAFVLSIGAERIWPVCSR